MWVSFRILFVLCFFTWVLAAQIQLSTQTLSFDAVAGGDPPPQQRIYVIAAPAETITEVALAPDGGGPGLLAPNWLDVKPQTLTVPGAVRVSINPSGLTAGTQATARILLTKRDGTPLGPQVLVNLRVLQGAPKLVVTPETLHVYAKATTAAFVDSDIVIRNAGGGSLAPVTANVVKGDPWLRVKVPESCAAECKVRVTTWYRMDTGNWLGAIEITTAAGAATLPVAMHVHGSGAVLGLEPPAVQFEARVGHGLSESRRILVYNNGDTPAEWIVEKLEGGSWLTLDATTGTSTQSVPAALPFSVNSSALAEGAYHALLRITSSDAPNSPLYLPVALRVSAAATPISPLLPFGGLAFTANSGEEPSPGVKFPLLASSATPVRFRASVDHVTGAGWLTVSPSSGSTSGAAPAQVVVSAASMPRGVYTGKIHFSTENLEIRSLNVTAISSPASGCVPTKIIATHIGLTDDFRTTVGGHLPISVSVLNDCGEAVTNAVATAEFSNGERPLQLRHIGLGVYAAPWSPSKEAETLNITAVATSPRHPFTERAVVAGSVGSGSGPVLAAGAILNNLNPLIGGAVAPGTVAQVYGANLATAVTQPGYVNGKLPSNYNGTSVLLGGIPAPLYYLSSTQVNVQVPVELTPGREYQALASLNGAWSVPTSFFIDTVSPGIAVYASGAVIAQDIYYGLINEANPAHPGNFVRVYLVGMGATNPAVSTGLPTPDRLHPALVQPTVSLDGSPVTVSYAGLTPRSVGLYQIDFQVPASARTGNLKLLITQNGVPANESYLPVRQ